MEKQCSDVAANGGKCMKEDLIMGLPALNFQALLGVGSFLVTWLLVKAIRGIQTGRYPGTPALLLYLRTVLGFTLAASMFLFFGAILGFRYV